MIWSVFSHLFRALLNESTVTFHMSFLYLDYNIHLHYIQVEPNCFRFRFRFQSLLRPDVTDFQYYRHRRNATQPKWGLLGRSARAGHCCDWHVVSQLYYVIWLFSAHFNVYRIAKYLRIIWQHSTRHSVHLNTWYHHFHHYGLTAACSYCHFGKVRAEGR